jgi:hypothetical protein
VVGLTAKQIAVLSTASVAALTTNQVSSLTNAQVIALTTAQVAALNTTTVGALTTGQISSMQVVDVAALTTASLAALTTSQVTGLTATQAAGLTTAQVASLTTVTVGALNTAQIAGLSTASIGALTTGSLSFLTTAQVVGLTAKQIAVLSTASVAALTTNQVSSLTNAQVIALTTAQASALTTTFVSVLSTAQIRALETQDLRQLTTANIAVLTTSQIASLSSDQVCALTTTQLAALTTAQIGSMSLRSPIVLDLNSDGINTLGIQQGVRFDISADGSTVQTGWVAPTDGLLVFDRNADNVINDGSELFGTSTILKNGSKAIDGYQALSELDSDGDGLITNRDLEFNKLGVWVDSNSNGSTESGEIRSLVELNITEMNLSANTVRESSNGNLIGLTSNYKTGDGISHLSADVWFVVDNEVGITTVSEENSNTKKLSNNLFANELVKAIGEFSESVNQSASLSDVTTGLSKPTPTLFTENTLKVNRLSNALKEYQAKTIDSAYDAIREIGSIAEFNSLSSPIEVRSDKANEIAKSFINIPIKS